VTPEMVREVLQVVLLLAMSVWVGGLITIAVVARVGSTTLSVVARVAFFQSLGRAYGVIGGLALLLALVSAGILAGTRPWNGLLTACAVVAAALVITTAVGIQQARGMTRLRRRLLARPPEEHADSAARRGAIRAAALRALIGVLSVVLVVLGVAATSGGR
jgi:hypothetical protein